MSWTRQFWNVLRPGRLARDLERELRFHLVERTEQLRAHGMSEEDAIRQALRQFGNFTTQVERTRDMDIHGWLEALTRNVRYAGRALRKTPAFAVTVTLTLALGIGANTAVFSAIDAVLLRPLAFPEADRLVRLDQVNPRVGEPHVAPVRLEEWNKLNRTFQAITGYYAEDESEISGELPEKLRRALVAPRFLQVLGVAPEVGRDFTPQEEHFGGPDAVLISDRLWRRRFNADPKVVGRGLRFGRELCPIVGVLPPSFLFPEKDVDLWSVPFTDRRVTLEALAHPRAIYINRPGIVGSLKVAGQRKWHQYTVGPETTVEGVVRIEGICDTDMSLLRGGYSRRCVV